MPRPRAALAPLVLLGLAAAGGALIPSISRAADLTPQQQIESRLMCYCGCADLTVRTCTCGTAAGMREEIAQRLADAQTPEQVTAAFVARYGEKILSAPTFQGFNLVAWITPFAVILAAGAGILVFIRRRGGPGPPALSGSPAGAGPAPGLSPREAEIMRRVEREIRESR